MDNDRRFWRFYFLSVFISVACFAYYIVILPGSNIMSKWQLIIFSILIIMSYIFAELVKLYDYKGMWAIFLVVLALVLSLGNTFAFISADRYIVIVKKDGYEVLRNEINIVSPLKVIKSEDIRKVERETVEEKFYEFKTGSYHFVKMRIISELRVSDDESIYEASSRYPGNAGKIKDYLEELIKAGEENRENIEKRLLKYARENILGFWLPTKIEILSLEKVQ